MVPAAEFGQGLSARMEFPQQVVRLRRCAPLVRVVFMGGIAHARVNTSPRRIREGGGPSDAYGAAGSGGIIWPRSACRKKLRSASGLPLLSPGGFLPYAVSNSSDGRHTCTKRWSACCGLGLACQGSSRSGEATLKPAFQRAVRSKYLIDSVQFQTTPCQCQQNPEAGVRFDTSELTRCFWICYNSPLTLNIPSANSAQHQICKRNLV